MLRTDQTTKTILPTVEGFQGFEPLTASEKTKLANAFPNIIGDPEVGLAGAQKAMFVRTTSVEATDDDAGDGEPIQYQKISYEKQKLFALADDVSVIVANMRGLADGTLQEAPFDCVYDAGMLLSFGAVSAAEPV